MKPASDVEVAVGEWVYRGLLEMWRLPGVYRIYDLHVVRGAIRATAEFALICGIDKETFVGVVKEMAEITFTGSLTKE